MSPSSGLNRAVGLSHFGAPDVLGVVRVPIAVPGPSDALVLGRAAAVNPSDTLLRTGRQTERLAGIAPPFIPGMELAGDIIALGGDAGAHLHAGQAVAGVVRPWRPNGGAQAQYVVVPAASLVPVPAHMGYAEAATILMNGSGTSPSPGRPCGRSQGRADGRCRPGRGPRRRRRPSRRCASR